jgi:hypothetical protein
VLAATLSSAATVGCSLQRYRAASVKAKKKGDKK